MGRKRAKSMFSLPLLRLFPIAGQRVRVRAHQRAIENDGSNGSGAEPAQVGIVANKRSAKILIGSAQPRTKEEHMAFL
jgi:hypothetical protein